MNSGLGLALFIAFTGLLHDCGTADFQQNSKSKAFGWFKPKYGLFSFLSFDHLYGLDCLYD